MFSGIMLVTGILFIRLTNTNFISRTMKSCNYTPYLFADFYKGSFLNVYCRNLI